MYWNQGRFKDALVKANEALTYYKTLKDNLGQASALITLAEVQRSDGDLKAAVNSLRLAEPLVNQAKISTRSGDFITCRRCLSSRGQVQRRYRRVRARCRNA